MSYSSSYSAQELKNFIAQQHVLLEYLPIAILISDKQGNLHYYNQEAEIVLGHKHLSHNKISHLFIHFDQTTFIETIEFSKKNTLFVTPLNDEQKNTTYQLKIVNLPIDQALFISQEKNYYLLTLYPFFSTSKALEELEEISIIKKDFKELMQFSCLNAMREISSSLADKLNQPLTAILSYTQAMQRLYQKQSSPQEINEAMTRVVINAENAGNIIRHVRSQLKSNIVNYQMTCINELIQECICLTELSNPLSSIQLKTQFESESTLVNIDSIQIKQLIFSLLNNAIDALLIPLIPPILTPEIKIETHKQSDYYKINIHDNGAGLPDKIKTELFKPFSTTKENSLGISLSMCHHIIELHHGDIAIQSNQYGLTIISIRLPLKPINKEKIEGE